MHQISSEQFELYRSLFRGRTDVYARHWEKNGKSGYSPAYDFNWAEFLAFKNNGGTLKNFPNKTLIPLAPAIVKKHLLGSHTIGIYPIIPGNNSYFIAADFDGTNWLENGRAFIDECDKIGLRAYMERSRSGNGCHAWIFFEEQYPCWKSRKIILEAVKRILNLSDFDKEISFDRLFPNQDAVTKDGFGNLIALPLQGRKVAEGNTIFLDPATEKPYADQWEFLAQIKKHNTTQLDAAYGRVFGNASQVAEPESVRKSPVLEIRMGNKIVLRRTQLPQTVVAFLKEKLNFFNLEYVTKKRLGKSVFRVEKFFKLIEESGSDVLLPRGFLHQLTSFLVDNKIQYRLADEKPDYKKQKFSSNIVLRTGQALAVEEALKHDNGVIVAPSGSGKTIIGLDLIAKRQLPALILVHRQQLMDQWIDRIEAFLGIPKNAIGRYSGSKKKPGKQITVAMMQTLNRLDLSALKSSFGTVITDECHHIPAKTFREVISQFNPRYSYGLTATPERKHNDEPLIYLFIGEIIARMESIPVLADEPSLPIATNVIIRETELSLPFKFSTDNFQLLAKIISFDDRRNQLLVRDIIEQVRQNRKMLVLSERRDHLEVLKLYLKGLCETIVISGEDSASRRHLKVKQIESGHYQVVLSTGQFFGEGLDIKNINSLVIAFPFSFEGKLIQYVGRLRGHNRERTIIDYRDQHVPFLERQFKQKQKYYKKLQATQSGR